MYKIVNKKALNPTVTMMDIYAPLVAKKAQPAAYVITALITLPVTVAFLSKLPHDEIAKN